MPETVPAGLIIVGAVIACGVVVALLSYSIGEIFGSEH